MKLVDQIQGYLDSHPEFPDRTIYDCSDEFNVPTVLFGRTDLTINFANGYYYPSCDGVWTEEFETLAEAMSWGLNAIKGNMALIHPNRLDVVFHARVHLGAYDTPNVQQQTNDRLRWTVQKLVYNPIWSRVIERVRTRLFPEIEI